MTHATKNESVWRTWLWIAVLVAIILGKGFLSFYVVSDLGQPTWSYRPVADVPAQSAYAAYQFLPFPQHVKGRMGE
ncbi:MAG: hypothetical protein ABIL58_06685 [Pseudomonadota bacterium]